MAIERSKQLEKLPESRSIGLEGASIMNSQVQGYLSALGVCVCLCICTHTHTQHGQLGKVLGKSERGMSHEPRTVPSPLTLSPFPAWALSHTPQGRKHNTAAEIGSCISVLVLIPYSSCHYDSISLGHIWLLEYQWLVVGEKEGVMKEDHKNTSGPSAK